jgi:2-polyprenyl-3-methyl-5-hydroxy-6-metoxy-1,4-benzoquinol methylase
MIQLLGQNEIKKIWEDTLKLDGFDDFKESMIQELCQHYGIHREDVIRKFENIVDLSKKEWQSKQKKAEKEIIDFYDQSDNYIFEHMQWHINYGHCTERCLALKIAMKEQIRKYLDFGSGVGSTGILFARNGFDVTLADISSKMLKFAEWRFMMRGLSGTFIDLKEENLPREEYDFITAIDVFEHVSDLKKTIQMVSSALKLGGILFLEATYGRDSERPMHIAQKGLSVSDMNRNRLTVAFKKDNTLICKKEKQKADWIRSYLNIIKSWVVSNTQDNENDPGVYIKDLEGGNEKCLVSDQWHNKFPSFSPDGDTILFVSWRPAALSA